MARPRSQIVDHAMTCYYHVASRCVRRAFLLVEEDHRSRKSHLVQRLKLLDKAFAIDVCSYSLMDNHIHLILRLDPIRAERWTDREVVRQWAMVHPPRNGEWRPIEVSDDWIDAKIRDTEWIDKTRSKLANLSQFMKDLKQSIAQTANREDRVTGHFWEGRFRSVALLDEEALLAATTYVDMNPFVAGKCERPEQGDFTSIKERAAAYRRASRNDDGMRVTVEDKCARRADFPMHEDAEAGIWFVPVQNHLRESTARGSRRRGLFTSLHVSVYLRIVDAAARHFLAGRRQLSKQVRLMLHQLALCSDRFSKLMTLMHTGSVRGHALGLCSRAGSSPFAATRIQ